MNMKAIYAEINTTYFTTTYSVHYCKDHFYIQYIMLV